ncbi:major facilitator superfamily domain-containing protein [Triangularia verruculosa]|uniref:Major facilitator superfamily domain-containing protein n=1 Tax=Triangularia verruculosa TaxID=2587418 RepID=A0AAN6XML0_9PEZI|nr:major facilitator superfamily domain-containing protein [Triangularia verruculosa]
MAPSDGRPSWTTKLKQYFFSSTHRHLPGEGRLIHKIDFFILTVCCLSYFLNYLDRTNLSNAYVSGMKEDLGFRGNQLNEINTCFTVGYVLGQVPSNLALHYVKPRVFFPAMMVVWAGLTMITASVSRPQHIMAIRFFQGIAESTTFVGTHYILGSWYTERELGKRSGIFTASGLAGTMIGGFIQSGIYSSMDRKHGLRGWRWLFIIDGIITLPVAAYGWLVFPDTPGETKVWYLTQREREMAVERVRISPEKERQKGVEEQKSPLSWVFVRKVLGSWEWWGFVMLWVIAGETESFSTNTLLALFLKSHPTNEYTVQQLNDYPTGVPAVGIVSTLFFATLTDFLGGKRWIVGYFIAATGICTSVMILAAQYGLVQEGRETAVVMAAYYWAGTVYACQATFFAWANDAMRWREPVFRSVVLAGMNLGSNAVNAWWSIVFYGASMAPWFTRGMYAMIATSVALAVWTAGLSYMTRRQARSITRVTDAEDGKSPEGSSRSERDEKGTGSEL